VSSPHDVQFSPFPEICQAHSRSFSGIVFAIARTNNVYVAFNAPARLRPFSQAVS
jgi:hypothetical protein